MKNCARCAAEISNRKKFCSDSCKYWFNLIKKDNEKHLPPVKKRNKQWCYVFTKVGNTISERGQGKRVGGMVKGSMAANVQFEIAELMPFTYENMQYHFQPKPGSKWTPEQIRLGDQTKMTRDEAEGHFNMEEIGRYAAHC